MRRVFQIALLTVACLGVATFMLATRQDGDESNKEAVVPKNESDVVKSHLPQKFTSVSDQEYSAPLKREQKDLVVAYTNTKSKDHGQEENKKRQTLVESTSALASEFKSAIHTAGGEKQMRAIMEKIYSDSALHEEAMRSMIDLDHALSVYGEEQASARALFGIYLDFLAKKGHRADVEEVMALVSRDLTLNGDRKGRRLDLEDAFLAWMKSIGNKALIETPDETLGKLSLTREGWKVAQSALSNQIPEVLGSEDLRNKLKIAMEKGTVQ